MSAPTNCPHCGRRFSSAAALSTHVRFECPVLRRKED